MTPEQRRAEIERLRKEQVRLHDDVEHYSHGWYPIFVKLKEVTTQLAVLEAEVQDE